MKKVIGLFLISSLITMSSNEFQEIPTIDKEVTGVNKEALEIKDINTEKELLQNQTTEKRTIIFKNSNFQKEDQKIKVVEGKKQALEDELSQSVKPKKSYLKYIVGAIGVIVITIVTL